MMYCTCAYVLGWAAVLVCQLNLDLPDSIKEFWNGSSCREEMDYLDEGYDTVRKQHVILSRCRYGRCHQIK